MAKHGVWKESGFKDFRDGTFGNAGQNLYVSHAGVLQRIHHFDINRDGYLDLLFVNSQDNNERPPIYVFADPLHAAGKLELPSNGSVAGVLADLNGDGYQDLVVAMQSSGVQCHNDLNAFVYYGSPEGLSERYRIELPAPNCTAVAVGDFNGDGLPDIAFASDGKLRIFYQQPGGFQFSRFVELAVSAVSMVAGDLDGDGCADLYVKDLKGEFILWGSRDGLAPLNTKTLDPYGSGGTSASFQGTTTAGRVELRDTWKPRILRIGERPHLFICPQQETLLIPVNPDRTFGNPLRLETGPVISAALGDVNGDGLPDLVLAARQKVDGREVSWIYWGREEGYSNAHRSALETHCARDAVVGDLDGDGCDEIVVCQGRDDIMYTVDSLIYHGGRSGVQGEPIRIQAHDPTEALIGRTAEAPLPQVVFINRTTGCVRANIPSYIYYGGPDGFKEDRREELVSWAAPDALCCDFNDDGYVDVFFANSSENAPELDPGSFLYWQDKDGFRPERKTVFPTTHSCGVVCADLNRDGYLDLITVGFGYAYIDIFYGGPNGFDLKHPERIHVEKDGIVYREQRWMLLADLNNDGWLDLVIPEVDHDRTFILWGGPDGFSMQRSSSLLVECAGCARAADLTGNGYLDLVIGTYSASSDNYLKSAGNFESFVVVYWNGPDGFRENRKMYLPAYAACSLAVADFNNDGILDIYAGSYHGVRTRDVDSFIYWGGPRGHYSAERRKRLFTHSASGCIANDFNEDGWIDLAVANHKVYGSHPGHSMVWWNGPAGFSEQRVTWLPTNGPHGMLVQEPGNIMDRSPEEFYVSSPYELPPKARAESLAWEAELLPKTWVRGQVRFAETREGLDAAAWQGADGPETWLDNAQAIHKGPPHGRWAQYRLALGAKGGGCTPRVTEVRLSYAVE
ncbi:MAG: VCBS repeat-containing protein [Kiritimatiellaeota bacterium]|nr:VCBS repeat-containing protein [Kiritimatiellota bacterium]